MKSRNARKIFLGLSKKKIVVKKTNGHNRMGIRMTKFSILNHRGMSAALK